LTDVNAAIKSAAIAGSAGSGRIRCGDVYNGIGGQVSQSAWWLIGHYFLLRPVIILDTMPKL